MKPPRPPVRSLAWSVVAGVSLFVRTASADVPQCAGTDTATQARARSEGLRRYRAATARGSINRVEMAAALEAFEAQCRAGDVTALEMRAYALAALGRQVDAAESLDAFLEARPLQTLDADARARVGAQRGAILAEVATLTVDGTLADSQVIVNGRPFGSVPRPVIRLAPGAVNLQVYGGNSIVLRRTFQMGPGETRREVVSSSTTPDTSTTNNATSTTATTTAPDNTAQTTTSTDTTANATTNVATSTGDPGPSDVGAPVEQPSRRMSLAIPIGLGAGALVVGGVAIGASLWVGGRAAELMKPECTGPAPDPACESVRSELGAATGVQITSIIVASGLAVGSIATTILWARSAPRAPQRAAVFCSPDFRLGGLSCAGRF